jgi:uncharacterized protein (TIGR01777 family)
MKIHSEFLFAGKQKNTPFVILSTMETVLITGGTGLIGQALTDALLRKNYRVIILTRKALPWPNQSPLLHIAKWDVNKQEIDKNAVGQADYIIHLAGASLSEKRWTKKRKQEIIDSRVKSSELLVKSLQEIPNPVKAVISASAIGYYGEIRPDMKTNSREQKKFVETDPPAPDFIGETCRRWEHSIQPVTELEKRLVILRIGIVFSRQGGIIAEFLKPLRIGIAPVPGTGFQTMSWIHIDDLVSMILFALSNESLSGCFNAVAPEIVSYKEFSCLLAKEFKGKFYVPVYVPAFLLKLLRGDMSREILKSLAVSAVKIQQAGFSFAYPDAASAIKQIFSQPSA